MKLKFLIILLSYTCNMMAQDFSKEWKEVDALMQKNLPKSAYEKSNLIFDKSITTNNQEQIVKSIFYLQSLSSQLEEIEYDSRLQKEIKYIESNISKVNGGPKSIVLSYLASKYEIFISQNYYKINQRKSSNSKSEDIALWSIKELSDKSRSYYLQSCEDKSLQSVSISNFQNLISNTSSKYCKNLYDFLAKRAIDGLSNERNYLGEPIYNFNIIGSEYKNLNFPNNIKLTFSSTESDKVAVIELYNQLINEHKSDADQTILIDLLISYAGFLHENYKGSDGNTIYEKHLNQIFDKYKSNSEAYQAVLTIASMYQNSAHEYQASKDSTKQWKLRDAVKLYDQIIANCKDKNIVNQATNARNGIVENLSMYAEIEKVYLPNKPILAKFSYTNLDKIYYRIYLNSNESQSDRQPVYDQKEIFQKIFSKKQIHEGSFTLKNVKDYHNHSTELDLPALEIGNYQIVFSKNQNFGFESNFLTSISCSVSNLAYFLHFDQKKNRNEIYVVDRMTGKPIENANVDCYQREYRNNGYTSKLLKKSISNKDGNVFFDLKNTNFFFKISKDKDELLENQEIYNYGQPNENQIVQTQYNLFLDRAIYRPGQTIYFKGIVFETSSLSAPKIVSNKSISVVFKDANYQDIERKSFTSNEFGTFNGTFTAPKSGLLGEYHIMIEDEFSKELKIEEYKRPSFEVVFDTFKGNSKLEEKITVTGSGKAYSGANLPNAKFKYKVLRQTSYPYWKCWWMPMPADEAQIAQGEGTTDDRGKFKLDYIAEPGEENPWDKNPIYRYHIVVEMMDISGETQESSTDISIGSVDFEIRANMKSDYTFGESIEISIDVVNLNGAKIYQKLDYHLVSLREPNFLFQKRYWEKPDFPRMTREEFSKKFPFTAYENEDRIENYEVKHMMDIAAQDSDGVLRLHFSDPGAYRLTISAKDKNGKSIQIIKNFSVNDASKPNPNKPIALANLKPSYEPGQTTQIKLSTTQKNQGIWYQWIRNGQKNSGLWIKDNSSTIQSQLQEQDRGGAHILWTTIQNNRFYQGYEFINIPWTNKELEIEYLSFRDKLLPGQKEEWKLKIKGKKGEKVLAEVLANMYDQSLDVFAANHYEFYPFASFSLDQSLSTSSFMSNANSSTFSSIARQRYLDVEGKIYPNLLWQDNFYGGGFLSKRSKGMYNQALSDGRARTLSANMDYEVSAAAAESAPVPTKSVLAGSKNGEDDKKEDKKVKEKNNDEKSKIKVRSNLNETVFFQPNILTDAEGNLNIKFTMNEALTKWKFMALALTKDLQIGVSEKSIVTQKELMIQPNAPRFMRENDAYSFTAKVTNLSPQKLSGTASIELTDAVSWKSVNEKFGLSTQSEPFEIEAGQTQAVEWKIKVPENISAVQYRVLATAGNFSDGEENTIPILSDKILVTETMPFNLKSNSKKLISFKEMDEKISSPTLRSKLFKLEYSSNPVWYAIQSLPYLMEYPHECTEQIFNHYFANSLSASIVEKFPKIKSVFDAWKGTDAMKSNLSKNQELKSALLEESPWVLAAQSEEEQRKNIACLFDIARLADEEKMAIDKLYERQSEDGSFPWFPGGYVNPYITQYVVEGLGHLKFLGVKSYESNEKANQILNRGISFIDQNIVKYYREMEANIKKYGGKIEDDHLDPFAIHYLYTRSYFDQEIPAETKKVIEYYHRQGIKYWTNKSLYQEGMLALYYHRIGDKKITGDMMKSFRERAKTNEEKGMYWDLDHGYYWYQLPIETHSLMTEVFEYISDNQTEKDNLKLWLLKNKQTNRWETTKSTASAIYALLGGKNDKLDLPIMPNIKLGDLELKFEPNSAEQGTGYIQKTWKDEEISKKFSKIEVENPNPNIGYGAVYWQYLESMNQIKKNLSTPLKLDKKIFIIRNSAKGESLELVTADNIKIGDRLRVRLILYIEREMEFLHLKDMRASGLEPIDAVSGYKWSGGLGYYQTTRDAAMNFFIDHVNKGTYTIEYDLNTNLKGTYSNGISTFQSMYAPEFNSHSEGQQIIIRK